MGYRTILSSPLRLTIQNTSGHRVVVSGANLAPGASREVARQVFVNDKFRAAELAELVTAGQIQVLLNGLGFVDYPFTVTDLTVLAANVAPKPIREYATAAFPAVGDVPVGTLAFDTTTSKLMYNDGSVWVDVTGA